MLKINTKWFQYDNSQKPVSSAELYEVRLNEMKMLMRMRYLTVLGIFALVVILVGTTSGSTVFVQQIAFGSTLLSMILSILAISVTVRREAKSDKLKFELDEKTLQLNAATKKLEEAALLIEQYSTALLEADVKMQEEEAAETDEKSEVTNESESHSDESDENKTADEIVKNNNESNIVTMASR